LLTMPIVLTSPANGEVLKYNGTTWVNSSDAGITGSGAAGQVAYFTGATTQGGSNNLFWDNTNVRLGIGNASPTTNLVVRGNTSGYDKNIIVWERAIDGLVQGALGYGKTSGGPADNNVYVGSITNHPLLFQTNNAERVRIFATGNFGIGTGASDSGQRLQVVGAGYFSDSVGIGSTTLTGRSLSIERQITGSVTSHGVIQNGTVQLDVTSTAYGFRNIINTVNSLTVGVYNHFYAQQGTIGTSNTITEQSGFFVANLTSGTFNFGFRGQVASGTDRWNLYMDGTANNFLSGNTQIGTGALTSEKLQVNGTMKVTGATTLNSTLTLSSTGSTFIVLDNTTATTGRQWRASAAANGRFFLTNVTDAIDVLTLQTSGAATFNSSVTSTAFIPSAATIPTNGMYLPTTNTLGWSTNTTERMRLDASGNLGLGTSTPTGTGRIFSIYNSVSNDVQIRLQGNVSGQTSTDGALISLGSDSSMYVYNYENAPILFGTNNSVIARFTQLGNLNIGTFTSDSGERLQVTGTAKITGNTAIGGTAGAVGTMQIIKTGTSPVSNQLLFGTDGTGYQFAIGKNQGGTITNYLTLQDNGVMRLTGSFVLLGGNALQFVNSAANTVSAIRPTGGGTSVMSTNSNGLHIAVGTEAAGDLILASNNTERVRLSSNGWFSHASATNPSSSVTDSYVQYSADVTAGNAAPHFRTENGAVIKLYQETTAVGNSIISLGGGSAVLDDTTFDGYTLRQIVKALRNQGILA
jgi:hypothetical protein